jgi:hypothetical protein
MTQNSVLNINSSILTIFVLLVTVLMLVVHGADRNIRDSRFLQFSVAILIIEMVVSVYYSIQYLNLYSKFVFIGILTSILIYLIEVLVPEPGKRQISLFGWA